MQDLETRTSQEHPRKAFIQAPLRHGTCKIFTQGPLRKDFTRISTKSSDKVLYKIRQGLFKDVSKIFTRSSNKDLLKFMQGPLTGFHQDLPNIFAQGPLQDLGQELHALRTSKTAPCNSCKIVIEGPSTELMKSLNQDLRESAKISTMPQRERSDTHKVPRRLRERYQNSQRTTTRAIPQVLSAERVAQAISKFAPCHNEI